MLNIKFSSSEINTATLPSFCKGQVEFLTKFETGDLNITLFTNDRDDIVYLRFVRREYYLNTEAAIERLQQIQHIEQRFKEYSAIINVHFQP